MNREGHEGMQRNGSAYYRYFSLPILRKLRVFAVQNVLFFKSTVFSHIVVIPSDFRILVAIATSWVVASGTSSKVYFIFSVFHLCRPKE